MPAIQPFLSRTGRHFATFRGAPDVALPAARRIGSFLGRAHHVTTLSPTIFASTASPTNTLAADPASFVATFAPASLFWSINAVTGPFVTTFPAAGLIRGRGALVAAKAAYTTTFNAAILRRSSFKLMTADPVSYVTTLPDSDLVIGVAGGRGVNVLLRIMKTKK